MRLYLEAKSKNKIGYTPDWLQVTFYENNKEKEITFDIQGEIDYDKENLSCRCKGELIPWVLCDCQSGTEIDLYSKTNEQIEKILPREKLAKIVCEGSNRIIGIYPATHGNCDDEKIFKMAKNDELSNCKGSFEMFVGENYYHKEFEFETEINIF